MNYNAEYAEYAIDAIKEVKPWAYLNGCWLGSGAGLWRGHRSRSSREQAIL